LTRTASLGFLPARYEQATKYSSDYKPFHKTVTSWSYAWVVLELPAGQFGGHWQETVDYSHADGTNVEIRKSVRIDPISRPIDRLSPLPSPPPNGTKVVLIDNQQIAAEWRNGEVVAKYNDKAVERLAKVEFQGASPWRARIWRLMQVLLVIVAAVAVTLLWKNKGHGPLRSAVMSGFVLCWLTASSAPCVEPRYCGIAALYGAACSLGAKGIEFADLIDPNYVGSLAGSSLQELTKAAEDHELNASPFHGLSLSSLRAAQDSCDSAAKPWLRSCCRLAGWMGYVE
jgi:hypothetical protein